MPSKNAGPVSEQLTEEERSGITPPPEGLVPNKEAGNTAPGQSTAGGEDPPAMVRHVTEEEEQSVFSEELKKNKPRK